MANRHVIGGDVIDEDNALPVEIVSGGGGGGGDATAANQTTQITALGANADAAVAAGAAGSLSAKLRSISRDLVANIVLAAGSAIIGKVGIDQTTPGTTNAVTDAGPALAGTSTYTASADMSSVADVGPAPTGGQKSVLREVIVSADTAMSVTLQMQTTPGAERIKVFLPANGTVALAFRHPRKLGTADKKWQALASVSGNIAITTVTTSEA